MRWNDLYVAGVATYLPQQIATTDEAVAAGLYDAKAKAVSGYRALRVAGDDEPAPAMAAAAGRAAVARSSIRSEEFAAVLHAYASHQGRDVWCPASYVHNETVGGYAPAFEVRQGCNGGLAAVDLAAAYLSTRGTPSAALITTGDAFHSPFIDRWRSDEQMVFGDGGTAIVLSNTHGVARVRATVSGGDPTLEILDRGAGPWTATPFAEGRPIDFAARKRDYLESDEFIFESVMKRMAKTGDLVLHQALEEAGTSLAEISFFIHGSLPEPIANAMHRRLGLDRARTNLDIGLDLGQMGAGDQLVGLTRLLESEQPRPGDLIVASGGGAGYVWTVAVLEILSPPQWHQERDSP